MDKAGAIDVGEPVLSQRGKAPTRFHDRRFEGDFTETAKDLHRQEYIEANDTISSPASKHYSYLTLVANEGM